MTPALLRAALAEFAPGEPALFETEFQRAMVRASETFELPVTAPGCSSATSTGTGSSCSLPAEALEQINAQVKELLENPHQPRSAYDERTDQWTTTYDGGAGLIVYAVVR